MVCVSFFTVKRIGECQNARITGPFFRFLNYRMVDFLRESTAVTTETGDFLN